MCLVKFGEQQVAKRDLVCYKYVKRKLIYKLGDSYSGYIRERLHVGVIDRSEESYYFLSWVDSCFAKDVLINRKLPNYYLVTPIFKTKVTIGNTYKSAIIIEHRRGLPDAIEKGLHSFCRKTSLRRYEGHDTVKVKCVIPKGSVYYKGIQGGKPGYVSDKLKYVQIIT